MKDGDIGRYVLVAFADTYKRACWYMDSKDEVEEKDLVEVSYGTQNELGQATQVLICTYPYVPYDNPKEIISIYKKKGSPKWNKK